MCILISLAQVGLELLPSNRPGCSQCTQTERGWVNVYLSRQKGEEESTIRILDSHCYWGGGGPLTCNTYIRQWPSFIPRPRPAFLHVGESLEMRWLVTWHTNRWDKTVPHSCIHRHITGHKVKWLNHREAKSAGLPDQTVKNEVKAIFSHSLRLPWLQCENTWTTNLAVLPGSLSSLLLTDIKGAWSQPMMLLWRNTSLGVMQSRQLWCMCMWALELQVCTCRVGK